MFEIHRIFSIFRHTVVFVAIGVINVSNGFGQNAMRPVTLKNFPESSVELIAGSSPQFPQLLANFVGPEAVSTLQPMIPYLVIVENTSTATIRAVTLIWSFVDTNNQAIPITGTHVIKPGIHPGEMILMAPISGLSISLQQNQSDQNVARARPTLQNISHLNFAMANFLRNAASRLNFSISVDSIIFEDHTFSGPDHSGMIAEENSERRIKRELVTELLKRQPHERSMYLKSMIEVGRSSAISEAGQRARIAALLLDHVNMAQGDEDLFLRSMQSILSDETQQLHRRNP